MSNERHQAALVKLREVIASGALDSNGRLPPERALAEDLRVGRRSLRRALDILEAEGQIRRQQGRGTFLAKAEPPAADLFRRAIELTNPIEVLEVRIAIEPVLARLAAFRASRCDIDKLRDLAEATRTAETAQAYERADMAFHRRVAESARNLLFLTIFDTVVAAVSTETWRQAREHGHCVNKKAIYSAFHRNIAEAIASRDGARAEEVMFAHLSSVQQNLLAATLPRREHSTYNDLAPISDG